jgi:hypothetical protein
MRMAIPEKATAAIVRTISEEAPIEKFDFYEFKIKVQDDSGQDHPYNSW